MTNIRILLMGQSESAKELLSCQGDVEFVNQLDQADYIMQDADSYRAGQYSVKEPQTDNLTRRELEVLRLTAEGLSVREVATVLFLSAKTVDAHKVNLMRKLKIHNKAHLVHYALRNRILTLDSMAAPALC